VNAFLLSPVDVSCLLAPPSFGNSKLLLLLQLLVLVVVVLLLLLLLPHKMLRKAIQQRC